MATARISSAALRNEPLAKPCKDAEPACASDPESCSSRASSAIALVILVTNCGVAIYRSWNDPWSVAFVAASFLILVALFHALHVFERTPRGSPRRGHVKSCVWVLTTVLTFMFSYRVAALVPFPVAVFVWAMAGSTIMAGFYVVFVCRDDVEAAAEEKPNKLANIV